MLKYTDVIKAINDKLKANFENITTLTESDIDEKIVRPSFMTSLDNIKSSNFMDSYLDKKMISRIYYFPSDPNRNIVENMNMIDGLNKIFVEDNLIQVNEDFFIEVFEEVDIDIVDKVVHFYLPIMISDEIKNKHEYETMEHLYFKE